MGMLRRVWTSKDPRVTRSASPEQSDDDKSGQLGLITAIGIAQICSYGTLFYSFPLIAEAMRADLGWSKPQLYGAATLGLVLAGLAAYPVGNAIDRGLGRWVMSLSSVAAGVLLFFWSQVTDPVVYYIIFAAIGCLHAATLYEPAFAVIARRVGPDKARRGITAVTLWGGFASTVFIPLIQLLIEWYGWRNTLMVLGSVNILICASLYLTVIDPTKDHRPDAPSPGQKPPIAGRKAVAWAFTRPVFWALLIAFMGYAALFSTLTFHLYPLLLEKNLDTASVVTILAVIGPAQVAGRILIWLFAPSAPIRSVGSVAVIVFPLAVLGFAFAPPQLFVMALIAAAYGAANGIITIVRSLAIPEMLSRNAYGAINGAIIGPMQFVQALAPLAAASIWAATSGYEMVLLAVTGAALVLAIGFWSAAALSRRN